MWREDGPNRQPAWTPLTLNKNAKSLGDCGIAHGDVLLVQEHPDRIARGLYGLRPAATGPEWLQQRARYG